MKADKIKKYYKEILLFFGFSVLAIVFTYPVIFKMNTAVYGALYNTDNRGTIWGFWWLKYAWSHGLSPVFAAMHAYPYGLDTATIANSSLSVFVYKWLTIFSNEIFTYNFSLLLNFFLAALFTYCLVYEFTKNRIASFISSIIFAFCPYAFNKAFEHFGLAQTFWVPLYSLALLRLFKKPSLKRSLLVGFILTLLVAFELNYAYIMSIFTLGFIIFTLFYALRNKCSESFWKFIAMFILSVLIAVLANASLIYPIINTILFSPKTDVIIAHSYVRPFHYLFTHSARPLSYLLPASVHPVFGSFTKSMFGNIFYGRNSIEQTLYLGWLPLILSFIAYKTWKKRKLTPYPLPLNPNFAIGFFLFTAILGFLFSMPPYINLGLFKIYFPSFFMYKILPAYRAYARFGVLVIFAVSILAGFGLKYILEKLKTFKSKAIVASLIGCFILFEFANIPPFRVTDLSNPPDVYKWLKIQEGDFAIAQYPMGEAGMGEAGMDYDYIFYQRIHERPLINGAGIGTKGYETRKKISNLMSPSTPGILKFLGAKYVIADLIKYKTSRSTEIRGQIPDFRKQKGLKLIKRFKDSEVYEVIAKPTNPDR